MQVGSLLKTISRNIASAYHPSLKNEIALLLKSEVANLDYLLAMIQYRYAVLRSCYANFGYVFLADIPILVSALKAQLNDFSILVFHFCPYFRFLQLNSEHLCD